MERNKSHAIFFLTKSDKGRYGQLVIDLENQYTRGTDQYPSTITETYNMLVTYKKPANNRERNATSRRNNRGGPATATEQTNSGRGDEEEQHDDVAFVQHASAQPPAIGSIKCFNCNEYGHYSTSCPNPSNGVGRNDPAIQLLQLERDDIEDGYDGTEDNDFSFNLTTENVTLTKKHHDWPRLDPTR